MKIPVTLNNTKTVFDAEPSESLLSVLRNEHIFSVKYGCSKGRCGNCMILLNDNPVPSCTLPVGTVRDSTIVTLEYFKTYPEYTAITTGFSQAGIHLCGYCNAGKIFTAYALIKKMTKLEVKSIYAAIKDLNCCCTDNESLINGILNAFAIKFKTAEGKNVNGKKQ